MKNLSLTAKMTSLFMVFTFACILISYLGITKLAVINDNLVQIKDVYTVRQRNSMEMRGELRQAIIFQKNMVLEKEREAMDKMNQLSEPSIKRFDEILDMAFKMTSEAALPMWQSIRGNFDEWKAVDQKIKQLALDGNMAETVVLSNGRNRELRDALEKTLGEIVTLNTNWVNEAGAKSVTEYEQAKIMMISISVISILLSLSLAFIILRSVNRSIDQVISNLRESSLQVTAASHQIASSSEELSQAATEQASSLEETSSAIEEMSSMIKKNADSAKDTTDLARVCNENALKGKEVMQEMDCAMQQIDKSNIDIMATVNESNVKISDIVKVISEIGNKTKVINDIVFQTKLLSFNASVEAARAGEHGKGFAVVAEEVGNLAQMSGNAAKEITTMLDSSIEKVEGIVRESKNSVETLVQVGKAKVERGLAVTKECGQVLDQIVSNVSKVNDMSQLISTACEEQAKGINEITKAVNQLEQVTQTNAASSEEAASSSEELSAQANNMQSVVQSLIETIKGTQTESEQNYKVSGPIQSPSRYTQTNNASNVIRLSQKNKNLTRDNSGYVSIKKAVGSDIVPSESDPRFKEI